MPSAATTSPFMLQEREDSPWLIWCCKEPVSGLVEQKQTDGRSVLQKEQDDESLEDRTFMMNQPFVPQTNRYQSVVSRMDQASRKAAVFSAWRN